MCQRSPLRHTPHLRLLLVLLGLSLVLPAQAQNGDPGYDHESDASWKEVYDLARKYGDLQTAATVLYRELAEQPDNNALKDSLTVLYFQSNRYVQAIQVGEELMKAQPENQRILELMAVSYQNLGAVKEALKRYESLYELSQKVYHLYQVAVLQYQLKRYGEGELSLRRVINDPKSEKEEIMISIQQKYRQKVPIRAAAYNVLGILYKDQKDMEKAKQAFSKAMKIAPDFALAKGNLQALQKGGQSQGPGRAPAPGAAGQAPAPKEQPAAPER